MSEPEPGVSTPIRTFPVLPHFYQCVGCAMGDLDPWATSGYCRRCGASGVVVAFHPRFDPIRDRKATRLCCECLQTAAACFNAKNYIGGLALVEADRAPGGRWSVALCVTHAMEGFRAAHAARKACGEDE